MMTPGDDNNKVLEEESSSTRSDLSHSETEDDNDNHLAEAASSPAGPADIKDSSNTSKICEEGDEDSLKSRINKKIKEGDKKTARTSGLAAAAASSSTTTTTSAAAAAEERPLFVVLQKRSTTTKQSLAAAGPDCHNQDSAIDDGGGGGGGGDDDGVTAQMPQNFCPKDEKSRFAYLRYISYLDSLRMRSNHNINNNSLLLPADLEPMAMPSAPPPQQEERPGAYSDEGLGTILRRLSHVRFSLFGVQEQPVAVGSGNHVVIDENDNFDDEPDSSEAHNNNNNNNGPRGGTTTEAAEVPASAILPSPSSNKYLSVATPIQEEDDNLSVVMETAEELDPELLQKRESQKTKRKKFKMCGYVIIVVCSIILGLSLGLSSLGRKEEIEPSTSQAATVSLTPSPTRPLPPMENLELLYDELPENTKNSLYNGDSPQYRAWEWLLNHPNITTYPEWRKKQVFAMTAFFYSFEGPNWPEQIQTRWLDVTTNECSWIFQSDTEVAFFAKESTKIFGDAYSLEDYRPCNEHGQLQTLFMHNLYGAIGQVVMPPEIGLLTSLRILVITLSQMNGKLSDDILVPELMELPNLLLLSLQGAGISGTIPTSIGMMKQLKSLVLGGNDLSGSIPTEIGEMTSLEVYSHDRSPGPGLNGRLPTELGLLTQLTALSFGMNSHTGQIPSQIGLLTQIRALGLWENKLTGSLPSQLGFLNSMTFLESSRNLLTGTIPAELASLSNMRILYLAVNLLTAEIPSELGMMTNMNKLWLGNNAIVGGLPSQLGKLSNLVELWLGNDILLYPGPYANFTGSFPRELWELSNLEVLHLPNLPNLSGNFPEALNMPNLTMLSLSGSPRFSGIIPDQACLFIGELDFGCSDLLCGCDCECKTPGTVNLSQTTVEMEEYSNLIHNDQDWPGLFPTPVNRSNAITINVRTDRHPGETKCEWSLRNTAGLWTILDSKDPQAQEKVHSYTKEVESNSVYRLELFDSEGDGTCCSHGFGWFSITNSTPSPDYTEGTVIWEAAGSVLEGSFYVYIWVDREGHTKVLEHLIGPRY